MADRDDALPDADPFWRWAPGGRPAGARPWLNALYLRDFEPKIGRDLAAAVDVARLWDLASHEFAHGLMGRTAAGQLLHNLFYGIYLTLYELDGNLLLRVPSWRLEGNERLAAIVWRLRSLLLDLEISAGFVDEALCTLITLVIRQKLVLTEQMPKKVYECGIRQIERTSDPGVWLLCETFNGRGELPGIPWFAAKSPLDLDRVKLLLFDIAQYALSPPSAALHEWWRMGRVAPPEDPWTRFAKALNCIKDAPSMDEAAKRLAGISDHVLSSKPIDAIYFDSLHYFTSLEKEATMGKGVVQYERDDPDPYADVAAALGLDPETTRTIHPVGSALRYLTRAHPTRQSDPIKKLFAMHSIIPFISREAEQYRCRYEVRVPLGPAVQFAAVPEMRQRMLDLFPPGRNFASFGRMTVLPVSPEVTLLWRLDSIAADLLTTERLRCLCYDGCQPDQHCPCATLLARIYRCVETDAGQPLSPPRCIA